MLYTCKRCGSCCKGTMGPFVFPSDATRISDSLNISKMEFLEKYCIKNTLGLSNLVIDIYSLKLSDNGCVFLNEDNLCDVYDFRPYQCVNAPYHFLSQSGFWQHMKCLDFKLLSESNSEEEDAEILKELIDVGYSF
ncbi:MAG: YkgJ family cysteine cluster protein [Clostridia bacterium]|nr:YkgJ family cysteine cluster protein [Clostridia bacterium]